jgi:ubiquinone/menaquinone biosynthesis C-methylase UbiE
MCRILKLAVAVALTPLFLFAADEYATESAKLADLMRWKPGDVIAEIGAGEGPMSFSAAARVGSAGHVYTTELDDKKVAHLKVEVEKRHLQNVTVVKADPIETNLPDSCCEAIFMRRVYHHFTDPARTDASIFRALKAGGLLAVIDFPPRSGLPAVQNVPRTHSGHGISKNVLLKELESAGFELVIQPDEWPNQEDYCIIVRKPGPPS